MYEELVKKLEERYEKYDGFIDNPAFTNEKKASMHQRQIEIDRILMALKTNCLDKLDHIF